MLEEIKNKHKEMMNNFIELTGISDYELAWICFMKGILFTLLLFWIF